MIYTVEIPLGHMIFLLSFMKIDIGVQAI
jgi:hypothetical protein